MARSGVPPPVFRVPWHDVPTLLGVSEVIKNLVFSRHFLTSMEQRVLDTNAGKQLS
jgi:hypothetical protein